MRTVVVQNWEESERDWGTRPDGFTIHLTSDDHAKYVEWFNKQFNNKAEVPDEYTRTSGDPILVKVSEALHKRITELVRAAKRSKRGPGIWGNHDKRYFDDKTLTVKDLNP